MPDEEIDLGATMAFVDVSSPSSTSSETLPALTILYHPDVERVGGRALLGALLAGRAVELSRATLDFAYPGATRAAPLDDNHLSRAPLKLIPLEGGAIRLSLEECRTVVSFRGELLREHRDFLADEVARGVVLEIAHRVVLLLHLTVASTSAEGQRLGLVGDSAGVQRVLGNLLVHSFRDELERLDEATRLGSVTPASQVARLADLEWKGNVRQLRSVVKQLVIGGRGADPVESGAPVERLLQEDRPSNRPRALEDEAPRSPSDRARAIEDAPAPSSRLGPASRRRPAAVGEAEIVEVLRACRWDRKAAAQRLRISRPSLYLLLENNPRFRTAAELTEEDVLSCHRECEGDLERMVDRLEVSERALRRRLRQLGIA